MRITTQKSFVAWKVIAAICCMVHALSAATFGKFTYTDDGKSITITGYAADAVGAVEIPATIAGKPVTTIRKHGDGGVFYECTGLTSVTIPASVTNIDEFTFYHCPRLTAISVDSLNSAYSSLEGVLYNKNQTALIKCPKGKVGILTIPSGVTSIAKSAFSKCSSLKSVTISARVTSIGDWAFGGCTGLTSVTIPSSVTSIGDGAFSSCNSLKSVVIPSRVTSIGDCAFFLCRSLTSVTIPASVTSIGVQAFQNCTSLTNVTIPAGVTSIEVGAFYGCTNLKSVTIGTGVTSIEGKAFHSCTSLMSISFLGNAPSLGEGVFDVTASGFSVHYLDGKTGFTLPKWNGYPAEAKRKLDPAEN